MVVVVSVLSRLPLPGVVVERDDPAVKAWRDPRMGAGVCGAMLVAALLRVVAGGFCAEPSEPELGEVCWRPTSGDRKGFRSVALAVSIRRRLAARPPGVWNDIVGGPIEVHFMSRVTSWFALVLRWFALICAVVGPFVGVSCEVKTDPRRKGWNC